MVSYLVLIIYNLFIPNLGRYDLKENFLILYNKVFYMNSTTFNINPVDKPFSFINFTTSIVIILLLVLLMNYIICKRSQRY